MQFQKPEFSPPLATIFPIEFEMKSTSFIGCLALMEIPDQNSRILIDTDRYLSHAEQRQMDSFATFKRKITYLTGRICAKEALGHYCGNQHHYVEFKIEKGVFDYPVVVSPERCPNLQVSISHCQDLSAAITFHESHPAGIDIEKINPKIMNLREELITGSERNMVAGLDGESAVFYTAIWAAKEALSKILKTGLLIPFWLLEIETIISQPYGLELRYKNFGQYKCMILLLGNRVLAVTIPKQTAMKWDFEKIIHHKVAADMYNS